MKHETCKHCDHFIPLTDYCVQYARVVDNIERCAVKSTLLLTVGDDEEARVRSKVKRFRPVKGGGSENG